MPAELLQDANNFIPPAVFARAAASASKAASSPPAASSAYGARASSYE